MELLRNMDNLDRKIISDLGSLGFQKSSAIANHLGIGERTVRRRIDSMLNNNIIKIIAV